MEFLRLLHQTKCLTIALRHRHTEIMRDIFLCVSSFFLHDHSDRSALEFCDSTNDGLVITVVAVSMEFHKICKKCFYIITAGWTFHLT